MKSKKTRKREYDEFAEENEKYRLRYEDFISMATSWEVAKNKPKEPPKKILNLETLHSEIHVGSRILEMASGFAGIIVEINEHKGIKVKATNRGECSNPFWVISTQDDIESAVRGENPNFKIFN